MKKGLKNSPICVRIKVSPNKLNNKGGNFSVCSTVSRTLYSNCTMKKKKSQEEYQGFYVFPEDETVTLPYESLEGSKFRNADGRFQQLNYKDFDFGAGEVVELLPERDAVFDAKKKLAVQFADVYQDVFNLETDAKLNKRWLRRKKQVYHCNDYMEMYGDKVYRAFFCKVRLCPLCAWRRSLKITMHVREILSAMMQDNPDLEFIFCTFTVPNVTAQDLKPKLNEMLKAWRRMTHSSNNIRSSVPNRFNNSVLGWYRGLEVTRNTEPYKVIYLPNGTKQYVYDENGQKVPNPWYNTYHPHFHCIFVVDKRYFDMKNKLYLNHNDWLNMWRWAMNDPTITQVDARKITPNKKLLDSPKFRKNFSYSELQALAIISAVTEAAKYTVKTDDYILSPEATRTLDLALERRQLVGFGGIMSDYRNKLLLDDEIDGDLLTNGATEIEKDAVRKCYAFHVGCGHYIRIDNIGKKSDDTQ